MEDCKMTLTPMQSNNRLENATENEIEEFKKLNLDYRSAVGSLNYISQCTRPDIAYVVGHLSQFLEKPSCQHWAAFKRVLRYLKATRNLGINYYKTDNNEIVGYSHSSWAEDLNRRSWTGYVFMYGGGAISWKSKKLGGVSTSSTEAEYRSYLSAFHEGKWLSLLEGEVHKENPKSITIYNNNQGAINRAKNPIYHSRTKHIDVHYNSIRDLINNHEVNLKYLETEELVADCLTKALDRIKQQKFNKYMGLFEYTSGIANIAINQDNNEVNSPLKLRGRVGRTISKSELEKVLSESEESNKLEKLIDKKDLESKAKIVLLDDFIGYNIKREVSLESRTRKLTKQRNTLLYGEKRKKRKVHCLINKQFLVDYKRIRLCQAIIKRHINRGY
ncbi:hypothetical protein O181_065945 [Austropuccinia psidii MF-1]|uniref:Uncharacterized protein n=1 Tax=Austropuccinia psidii MF-1 TaxID=1389203 RepID=A0A9Q3EN39_9BASI|nr:hypothetical protein [Austropuccinia psidii MF-1]